MKKIKQLPKGIVSQCFHKLQKDKMIAESESFALLKQSLQWLNVLYDADKDKIGDMAWYLLTFCKRSNLKLLTDEEIKTLKKLEKPITFHIPPEKQ